MIFSSNDCKTFTHGIEKEWLLTNGLGGYASSTIIGANTRRYHGLLIASLKSPIQRHLIISNLHESLEIEKEEYSLYSYQTPGYIHDGYKYIHSVNIDDIVEYSFKVKDVFVEKKISMVYGKNTVAIVYKIKNGDKLSKFKVEPLVNFRDFHGNAYKDSNYFNLSKIDNGISIRPNRSSVDVLIQASEGEFYQYTNTWFFGMEYYNEIERGLNPIEDHFMPGYFEFILNPNESKVITVIGSIDKIDNVDGVSIIQNEKNRIRTTVNNSGFEDDFMIQLVKACDQFIVEKESTNSKTIIAGYHWFSDWGRDTMIALSGLTLTTKRYDDAKSILFSFAKYINNGLVPNMFPDAENEPIYNSVDASLLIFEAINLFLEHTKDYDFIKDNFYIKLKEIIECYKNGTLYNIKMDSDGLISAGEEGVQLTWMDAKIGDWVVTPRIGKAVEINALWYNSLKVMSELSKRYGENFEYYENIASEVKKSFEKFWNEDKKCLYDVIDDEFKDESIRPNQILALSLSYQVVDNEKGKLIVNRVFEELYTNFSIRSLSPNDVNYIGKYNGNQLSRDSSYHQGTAWGWLVGQFIQAYLNVNDESRESKEFCKKLLEPFKSHIRDAGVGSISEIFEGDNPNLPKGCIAQAWSVSEILRSYARTME